MAPGWRSTVDDHLHAAIVPGTLSLSTEHDHETWKRTGRPCLFCGAVALVYYRDAGAGCWVAVLPGVGPVPMPLTLAAGPEEAWALLSGRNPGAVVVRGEDR